jgi:hypothetical protein
MNVRHFPPGVVRKYAVSTYPLADSELARAQSIRHALPCSIVRLRSSGIAFGADSSWGFENFCVEASHWLIPPLQVVVEKWLFLRGTAQNCE